MRISVVLIMILSLIAIALSCTKYNNNGDNDRQHKAEILTNEPTVVLVNSEERMKILYFGSKFCPSCVKQKKILDNMTFDNNIELILYSYDIDNQKPFFDQYNINSFPKFVFIKNGVVLGKVGYCDEQSLHSIIEKMSGAEN